MEAFNDPSLGPPGPYVPREPERMRREAHPGPHGFPPVFRPVSVYATGRDDCEGGEGGGSVRKAGRASPVESMGPERSGTGSAGSGATAPHRAGREEDRNGYSELVREIRRSIRDYPDFPEPGILFRDIAPLLGEPRLLRRIVAVLAEEARRHGAEKIAGIESRGFLLGTPVAVLLDVPFVPIRKQGKLPGETVSIEYQLEYGSAHLELQSDRIAAGQRIVVIDDLLATGGTAAAAARLVERLGGIVAGNCFLIELEKLDGRRLLGRYNVFSVVQL